MRTLICACTCALLLSGAVAEAKDRAGRGPGRSVYRYDRVVDGRNVYVGPVRPVRPVYVAPDRGLPPGLRKKLRRTGTLPPGWQRKVVPVAYPAYGYPVYDPYLHGPVHGPVYGPRGYKHGPPVYGPVHPPRRGVVIDARIVF
jgi:hypothetical protein